MTKIVWDDSYSVDNPELDKQHKEWISIFNTLHNSLLSHSPDKTKKVTAESLKRMHEYAEYHFKFEEEYLRKIDYPKIVSHIRLHKDFASKLYQYKKDNMQGKIVLNTKIIKTLKTWLVNHILNEDQKYSAYANKNNE